MRRFALGLGLVAGLLAVLFLFADGFLAQVKVGIRNPLNDEVLVLGGAVNLYHVKPRPLNPLELHRGGVQ